MTEQEKESSSQENEKSAYPAPILTNLTVEDLKNYLIKKWSKELSSPDADDFKFILEELAETTAQNYSLVSQIQELQTGYTELAKANLSRKQELVSITFEQHRIHEQYAKNLSDVIDRIEAVGL